MGLAIGALAACAAVPSFAFGGAGGLDDCATFTSCTAGVGSAASISVRYAVTDIRPGYVLPSDLQAGVQVFNDAHRSLATGAVRASLVPEPLPLPFATGAFFQSSLARADSNFGVNRAEALPGRGTGGRDVQSAASADVNIQTFAEADSGWRDVWRFSAGGHLSAGIAFDGRSSLAGIPNYQASYDKVPLDSFGDWFYDLRVYDVSHFQVSDEFELGGPTLVARVRSAGNDERRASFAGLLALDFDFLAGTAYVVTSDLRTVSFNGREIDLFNTVRLQDLALSNGVQMSALSGHGYALTAPVPEPSTWALLLAGMLVTTRIARRRRA